MSRMALWESELTRFLPELTEVAAELSEFSLPKKKKKKVLSKQYSTCSLIDMTPTEPERMVPH